MLTVVFILVIVMAYLISHIVVAFSMVGLADEIDDTLKLMRNVGQSIDRIAGELEDINDNLEFMAESLDFVQNYLRN